MIKVWKKKGVLGIKKDILSSNKNKTSVFNSKDTLFDLDGGHTIELLVPKTVYPPREDSKLLLDCINSLNGPNGKALEIGCGTGIISIALAKKGWEVEAIDINPYAVISTKENIRRASVEDLVLVSEGGLGEEEFSIPEDTKLIVWNLPYLTPPKSDEQRLEWIEEASMSDLEGEGWGHLLAGYLELNRDKLDPELLVILLQRKYPESPSKIGHWANLGWSHRVMNSRWVFDEKLEVVAYWKPGLGVPPKKLDECDSTMDEAKKLPQKGWQRVLTRIQTRGRGRRGSSWISKNDDLLATWSTEKSLLNELDPGLLQVITGAKISQVIGQYCKWPNDIVNKEGVKIGGVLVEMDSESMNLRIGVGINQFNDTIGNLKIKGWREITHELRLEKLFPIIDAELSTLFEKHPLLEDKVDKNQIKSESWRSLSKLTSRGYTIETEKGSSRITKLNTNGELSVVSNNYEENINNVESIRWSF